MRRQTRKPVVGVGLSGGADSAMSACLLQEQGYDVRGYTFRVWHDPRTAPAAAAEQARAVAERLGIPHSVLDFTDAFKEIIVDHFVAEYAAGRTPSPCARCNVLLKFGLMLDRMLADGCDAVATGHYARTVEDADGRVGLYKGVDQDKDQSYFLAGLRQDQLRRIVFPLGESWKRDIKAEAVRRGLIAEDKGESQDLCFLPDGDYARLVADLRPECCQKGAIVDLHGRVLGEHEGSFRYTIGQRRGLGLSGGPWYVVSTDMAEARVTVGPRQVLAGRVATVTGMNWLVAPPTPGARVDGTAKLRYNMRGVPAQVAVGETPEQVTFFLQQPVHAITPGQFAVLYAGDRVLGGGWIQASMP